MEKYAELNYDKQTKVITLKPRKQLVEIFRWKNSSSEIVTKNIILK